MWRAALLMLLFLMLLSYVPVQVSGEQVLYYKRVITIINNVDQALYNYTVRIVLNSSWFNFSRTSPDRVYFEAPDGSLLWYWVEEWNPSAGYAVLYVRVPYVPPGNSTSIVMFYGGNETHLEYRSAAKVFELFSCASDASGSWSSWQNSNPPAEAVEAASGSVCQSVINMTDDSSGDRKKAYFTQFGQSGDYEIIIRHLHKKRNSQSYATDVGVVFNESNVLVMRVTYDDGKSDFSVFNPKSLTNIVSALDVGPELGLGQWGHLSVRVVNGTPFLFVEDAAYKVVANATLNYTLSGVDVVGFFYHGGGSYQGSMLFDFIAVRRIAPAEPDIIVGPENVVLRTGSGSDIVPAVEGVGICGLAGNVSLSVAFPATVIAHYNDSVYTIRANGSVVIPGNESSIIKSIIVIPEGRRDISLYLPPASSITIPVLDWDALQGVVLPQGAYDSWAIYTSDGRVVAGGLAGVGSVRLPPGHYVFYGYRCPREQLAVSGNVTTKYITPGGVVVAQYISVEPPLSPPPINVSGEGWRAPGGNVSIPLPSSLERYKGWIVTVVVLVLLLLGNEMNAPVLAVGALGVLAAGVAVGWVSLGSGAVGLAVVVVGLGLAFMRKNG